MAPRAALGIRLRPDHDAWVVLPAREGAPLAGLGLREGDRIVAVNGRPLDEYTLPPGAATVMCTVRRGIEKFDVQVPVVVLVP